MIYRDEANEAIKSLMVPMMTLKLRQSMAETHTFDSSHGLTDSTGTLEVGIYQSIDMDKWRRMKPKFRNSEITKSIRTEDYDYDNLPGRIARSNSVD